MKKFCLIPLLAALAIFASCQKQQTEEERKAEVERQVQDRLAAERADAEKKRLADEQAALAYTTTELATATPAEEQEAPPAEEVSETTETRTEEPSTASYGMFYEKLEPHGEWRETNEYGYVWQPREAETSRDWRPYTEGRWAYSDAGWTWISDEPFGWATYHYGRWVRLRRIGWVWVPGNEWAPAWVSWRTSKDYVGWAPLPPEARFDRRSGIHNWADNYYDIGPDQYAFVSSNDFGSEHVRRAVVPAERNISIVVDTTNVTRITFANTTIRNEGPSYEELRSRGPHQIERYRLRRERNTETQARVRGDELEVSVPQLTIVHDFVRPRRIKERVVDVNIDNGWTFTDRSAAERARTKIRAEATPPPNAPPKRFVRPIDKTPASTTPATTTASASPVTASPTPAATAAASASPVTASPTPMRAKSSATPVAASPTPATTKASPTPAGVSPTPAAASPTPSIAKASPTPTAAPVSTPSPATAVASPTPAHTAPAISASPATRPSHPPRPRPSPSIPASVAPAPSVATTPVASPSVAATASIAPPPKMRPSPSIPPRAVETPAMHLTTPPARIKPVTPATPAPDTATTPAAALTPPVHAPSVRPRLPMPSPTPADASTNEAARPPAPRDIPRRTMPPRLTVPPVSTPPADSNPAATTTPAASVPAVTNEPPKNRRQRPPVSATTESGTPTPTPTGVPQ
jgi:hypothetical protein